MYRKAITIGLLYLTLVTVFMIALVHYASAQQNMGAFKTPQINTDFYVGQIAGFYPSIQNAVSKACTTSGARVIIPAGATPSDIPTTAAGCSQVTIEDRRTALPGAYRWSGSIYVLQPYGGVPGGSTLQLQANVAGSFFGLGYSTDSATHSDLLGVRNATTANLGPTNPNLRLMSGAMNQQVTDWAERDASGNLTNPQYTSRNPQQMNIYSQRAYGTYENYTPLIIRQYLNSGSQNTVEASNQTGFIDMYTTNHGGAQVGGAIGTHIQQNCCGDTIRDQSNLLGSGSTRGFDEGLEPDRQFTAFLNATFGGNVAISATNALGNTPMQLSNPGNYGYDFNASAEERDFIDVTKKWTSAGNIAAVKSWATDTRFVEVDGDAASGITAKWGVSSFTTTTAAIDSEIYTGTCPNVVDTGTQYPGGNAFLADAAGVNVYAATHSSSPANYCISVLSTQGLTPGTRAMLNDSSFKREYITVLTVPDSTHVVANVRHAKAAGAYLSWGGAVGHAWSTPFDDRVPGQNSTTENNQSSIVLASYPIMMSLAGDKLILDTQADDDTPSRTKGELRSLLYAANTPVTPLTISSTIVGGVITAISANAPNYSTSNFSSGVGNLSGVQQSLPAPALTFSCAGTQPVVTFSRVNGGYVPNLVSGGTSCTAPGITVATTSPNPFVVYPHTITYRDIDPNNPDPKTNAITGYMMTEGISSEWANGDLATISMWTKRYGEDRVDIQMDPVVARSGSFGAEHLYSYGFLQNNMAYTNFMNMTPSLYYIGTFANGWTHNLADARYGSLTVGPTMRLSGINGGAISMDLPPISNLDLQNNLNAGLPGFGGTIISVGCSSSSITQATADHPCLHGRYDPFYLITSYIGGSIVNSIGLNPTTGDGTYGGGRWVSQGFLASNGNYQANGNGGNGYFFDGVYGTPDRHHIADTGSGETYGGFTNCTSTTTSTCTPGLWTAQTMLANANGGHCWYASVVTTQTGFADNPETCFYRDGADGAVRLVNASGGYGKLTTGDFVVKHSITNQNQQVPWYAYDDGSANQMGIYPAAGFNLQLFSTPGGHIQFGGSTYGAPGSLAALWATLDNAGLCVGTSCQGRIDSAGVGSFANGSTVSGSLICRADGTNCPAGISIIRGTSTSFAPPPGGCATQTITMAGVTSTMTISASPIGYEGPGILHSVSYDTTAGAPGAIINVCAPAGITGPAVVYNIAAQ